MKSSKSNKKYKAIIIDVDGTLIANHRESLPSKKVAAAIQKARNKVHVGVATSRPIFVLSEIFSHLNLSGPSIINGGATIIDSETKTVVWEKSILKSDIKKIAAIANKYKIKIFFSTGEKDYANFTNQNILQAWAPNLNIEDSKKFIKEIDHMPTIADYQVISWENGKIDLVITHAEATKQHGIWEVAKILNISTDDIIGVGDGYNDFPLLMACGLKVAMGNAVDDLKQIADYIAPSVDEDGVADVINKFIL